MPPRANEARKAGSTSAGEPDRRSAETRGRIDTQGGPHVAFAYGALKNGKPTGVCVRAVSSRQLLSQPTWCRNMILDAEQLDRLFARALHYLQQHLYGAPALVVLGILGLMTIEVMSRDWKET